MAILNLFASPLTLANEAMIGQFGSVLQIVMSQSSASLATERLEVLTAGPVVGQMSGGRRSMMTVQGGFMATTYGLLRGHSCFPQGCQSLSDHAPCR